MIENVSELTTFVWLVSLALLILSFPALGAQPMGVLPSSSSCPWCSCR